MKYAEWITKHYGPLVGGKIVGIVYDTQEFGEPVVGLKVERDGHKTTAWILRDPEGNGPGHMEIDPWVRA
jgi:hypothetical protein